MATINRKFFFDYSRQNLFDGKLSQGQVAGLTTLLDYWEGNHASKDDRWLAYLLATAHHETDRTIAPIREYGNDAYFTRRYDPPPAGKFPAVAKQLGNTRPGDGPRFCGRGFVQLTGRRNYGDWAARLGQPLLDQPTLVMTVATATRILVEGSILGTFTTRKLADYLNPTKADWVNARRVINGTDKAQLIASYALKYYAAISYTV